MKQALISAYEKYAEEIRADVYKFREDNLWPPMKGHESDPRLNRIIGEKMAQRTLMIIGDALEGKKKTRRGLIQGDSAAQIYFEMPVDLRRELVIAALNKVFACNLNQEDLEPADLIRAPSETHEDVPMRAFALRMMRLFGKDAPQE